MPTCTPTTAAARRAQSARILAAALAGTLTGVALGVWHWLCGDTHLT